MDREAADCEGRVQAAQPIDVVDHTQQNWGREGCVCCEALEVVFHANGGRGAGVETRQSTVGERDFVVVDDQFGEHEANEVDEIGCGGERVVGWHGFHGLAGPAGTFGRG